jgi:ABC-type branched-subunit amino acid transport system permease subunit
MLWALAVIAVALAFNLSPIGMRLAASREDEFAAKSIGIRVWWERGVAFVLSAAMTGAGGALFALYFRSLNPDSFYINITFTVVAMLVIVGFTSLSGAVIGTLTLTTVLEVLREIERGVTIGSIKLPSRPGLTEVAMAIVLLITLVVIHSVLVTRCTEFDSAFDDSVSPRPSEPIATGSSRRSSSAYRTRSSTGSAARSGSSTLAATDTTLRRP